MKYIRLARRAAAKSDCYIGMSAILVRGGRIVAVGNNTTGHRGASIHAEQDVLRQVQRQKNRAEGADMYVFRFGADGHHRHSKPCRHCYDSMREAGVSRVFYYDEDGTQQRIKLRDADPDEFYLTSRNLP